MILQVIKWWREIVLGSSRAFTRELSRAWQDALSFRNGHQYWKTSNFNSKKQIRVLVYRECDWRGRKLLYDSKTVRKIPSKQKSQSNQFNKKQTKDKNVQSGFEFLKTSSDEKMLGEMIFGSVAMSFHGTTMKIHTIRSPPQLMMSFVFPVPTPSTENHRGFNDSGSLQNSTSEIFIPKYANANEVLNTSSVAHSVPLDVPFQPDYPNYYTDSSFNDSFQSSTSNSSVTSVMYSPDSQTSSLTRSSSYNSFQRRLQRNMHTNIELGLGKRFDEMQSYYEERKFRRRRVKFGLSIVFSFEETSDDFSNFQEFFFSHITLIEGHVNKLVQLATEPFPDKQSFLTAFFEGTELFQLAIQDLYTSPRLPQPLWLSMASPTSNHHFHCQKLMSEFLSLIRHFDTKQTHFFVSTLLTSVLTHHLAWVSTVTPTDKSSSHNFQRKETANWLDSLAKSHPYNPLWMQLGDLYGAVGFPTKISRTIVRGCHSNTVMKFLYVLSYFVRCSDVYEKIDEADSSTETFRDYNFVEQPDWARCETKSFESESFQPNQNISSNCDECAKDVTVNPKSCKISRRDVQFIIGDSLIMNIEQNLQTSSQETVKEAKSVLDDLEKLNGVTKIDDICGEEPVNCDSLGYGSLKDTGEPAVYVTTGLDEVLDSVADSSSPSKLSAKAEDLEQLLVNQAKLYIQEYRNLRFAGDEPDTCEHAVKGVSKIEESEFKEEGYLSMEDVQPMAGGISSLGSIMDSLQNSYLPNGTKEINLARVNFKEVDEGESLCNGFGWSLLAGVSDHYLSDFCLQGVVGELSEDKLYEDLTSSLKASVLGEPVASAICIVADTDLWSVKLCSSSFPDESKQKYSVNMSPLVAEICDSLLQMSRLNMSEEFCLMHLEDRLQELFFRSQSLASMLQETENVSLESLAKVLGLDMHDLPLLISVASTHTPQLSRFNR